MQPQTSRRIALHSGFAILAVVVLLLPGGSLGPRVLALVVLYHCAVVVLAPHDGDLRRMWLVLAPLSLLMVLPDWFLSQELATLYFPDTGSPFLGTVPIFMAGLWTIALLPVMLLAESAERARGVATGFVTASAVGLLVFTAAEWMAPGIPLWEPRNVATLAGVAPYVLVPELGLAVATYALVRGAGRRPKVATAGGIVAVPFMYLGMLVASYQFVG